MKLLLRFTCLWTSLVGEKNEFLERYPMNGRSVRTDGDEGYSFC
jgi:hypothetical protein